MATQAELEELLQKIVEAKDEVQILLREVHGEMKALSSLRKAIRRELDEAVTKEVATKMAEVAQATKDEMSSLAVDMIDSLARQWREKLGL